MIGNFKSALALLSNFLIAVYESLLARAAQTVGNTGKVIAVEPSSAVFRALVSGMKINKLTNVIPVNIAAWNNECVLRLYLGQTNIHSRYFEGAGWSSVKRKVGKTSKCVHAKPLDNVLEKHKIDHVD